MCGISGGFWRVEGGDLRQRLNLSLSMMAHRGPDDHGVQLLHGDSGVVALAHARLSIIDLSSAGHQPMTSSNSRYSMVFNGEIYNYQELRRNLVDCGYVFHSDSDTEVLLNAWAEWGAACLPRLEGMFSFVVYDSFQQCVTAVRDGFGIKPLFYELNEGRFIFASEQAALLALKCEKARPNLQRSYDYLVHGDYDSNEQTFFAGINHLLPGHMLTLYTDRSEVGSVTRWWEPSLIQSSRLTFSQAAEALREQFLTNLRLHLRSDVAIGAALSGGIDSSAVVCGMRYIEPDLPINTFSYIAEGSAVSEEYWVDKVNAYVGAKAHKITATGEQLMDDLDAMIRVQGEPFGSTSIYAQYRVFQLAKASGVTVTLDGQGADELLAGYSGYPGHRLMSLLEDKKYLQMHQFARNWSKWPGRSYSRALMYLAKELLPDNAFRTARKFLGRDFAPDWLNADMLASSGIHLNEQRAVFSPDFKGRRVIEQLGKSLQSRGLQELLRHGDRNSMKFSVESRVPFLTVPIANLLLSVDESYLISATGETKSVFREAMRGIVPDEILSRRDKIGFATPEKTWLLGMAPVIREWLQGSEKIPFINSKELISSFDNVVAGRAPFSWQVWRWVNYVRWYNQNNL